MKKKLPSAADWAAGVPAPLPTLEVPRDPENFDERTEPDSRVHAATKHEVRVTNNWTRGLAAVAGILGAGLAEGAHVWFTNSSDGRAYEHRVELVEDQVRDLKAWKHEANKKLEALESKGGKP